MEAAECVQVAVRIRPLVESETQRGCQQCLKVFPTERQVQVCDTDRAFTYNYVFDQSDSQSTFYSTAVEGLVTRLFEGYNVTILAYGQTGSGKTYSMGTCYSEGDDAGVIPRAISDVFEIIKCRSDCWKCTVHVSFLELYQEQLYDLLAPSRSAVDIREDTVKGICIPGVTEVSVASVQEALDCLIKGSLGRATGATAMNAQSSRSHAIFTVTIQQQNLTDVHAATTAKFHLVDLAGSERSKKTKATGERFKEGVNINRGLLALGNVISALGDGKPGSYICYRDSKLTRLLQDSLGGNSLTLMVACVSPADYNVEETLSTLRYADRARRIRNRPLVNHDPASAEIQRLRAQVAELLTRGQGCPPEHSQLQQEVASLQLKAMHATEQINNLVLLTAMLQERAMMAEQSRDNARSSLEKLKADALAAVGMEGCPEELHRFPQLIQNLLDEHQRGTDELLSHELSSGRTEEGTGSHGGGGDEGTDLEAHTMRQEERTRELAELNHALALKEELVAQLGVNSLQMEHARAAELEQQVAALQQEKEQLLAAKRSEPGTKRLQELEQRLATLQRRLAEQSKVLKLKEKSDEKVRQLAGEIQQMKQAKVKLIRQMRAEGERFRTWKLTRERELSRLRTQDQRRQHQLVRMETLHTRQQNVLRRKVEEAAAINRRLKEALALQKSTVERRAGRPDSGAKLQKWLQQELEVMVSTIMAERTLEQLMEDRALLSQQLEELKKTMNSKGFASSDDEADMEKDMKQLTKDIDLRSTQIAELQKEILGSELENKARTRWDSIQSMTEAKVALRFLFDTATDFRRELATKSQRLDEIQDSLERAVDSATQAEKHMRDMASQHQKQLLELEKEHQEKLYMLLTQTKPNRRQKKTEFKNSSKVYYEHEQMTVLSEDDAEDAEDDDTSKDPDWQKTPIYRRIQSMKAEIPADNEDKQPAVKRTSDGRTRCSCKGRCATKQCGCRKMGEQCNSDCRCSSESCQNKEEGAKKQLFTVTDESSEDEGFKKPRPLTSIENIRTNGVEKPRASRRYFPSSPDSASEIDLQ